jgi:hypothetical protein
MDIICTSWAGSFDTQSPGLVVGVRGAFNCMGTTRQQIVLETLAARQRAAELVKQLEQAQQECDGCLKSDQRQDMMKTVTGKSSIETAIASARRMVEMLDRALNEAQKGAEEETVVVVRPVAEVVGRIGPVGIGRVAGGR